MPEREHFGYGHRSWIAIGLLGPAAALAMLSEPIAAEGTTLDLVLDTLAWLTLAAGVALRFWAMLYISGRKHIAVVQQGPYSLCRNPLYVGSFLIACSAALFLQSPVVAAAVGAAGVLYARTTVPVEEAYMRERLGEEYDRYCEQVPRFLPRSAAVRVESPIVVHLSGLHGESRRALQWVALPMLGEMLMFLRSQPWWPHLWACGSRAVACWLR